MPPPTYLPAESLAALKASFPMSANNFAGSVGELVTIVSAHAVSPGSHGSRDELQGAEVVCEIVVSEDMLNISGFVHGGCSSYLIDICSSYPLVVAMQEDFWMYTGVSQGMHIVYHSGARLGDVLKITSTILNVGKRVANLRCEIAQKDTGVLVATGVHSKVDVFTKDRMYELKDQESKADSELKEERSSKL